MRILGLTGSIGMGKSTVAGIFRDLGVPVFDADAAVHEVYARGGAAVTPLQAAFPAAVIDGAVDRTKLSAEVIGKPDALLRLESIVHPLVQEVRNRFMAEAERRGDTLLVFDIPLLFETGGEKRCDETVVVSAPADVQRARVLARPGMTPEKFAAILAKQMPDADKRARATYVISTGGGLEETRAAVVALVSKLRSSQNPPHA